MQIEAIETATAEPSRAAFTVDPKALETAAAFLSKRVTERRNTFPILACVMIEADAGGTVTLAGTDTDQIARVTLAANVETPGAVCVDAAALADAAAKIRKGGAGEVRIADNGRADQWNGNKGPHNVTVTAGRAAFALKALPADDFPRTVTPTVDEALSAFTVPAARFLSDLAALAPCVSTEETRYYLNGVAFQIRQLGGRDRLSMVATDGHNIGAVSRPIPVGAEALADSILPRKAVANLRHAAKLAPDCEAIAVEFEGDRAARFTLGPVMIETKLIDGTFPDWTRPFEGSLTPIADAAAPLFPELVAGAPLASMAKLEKGAGQAVEWQEAASGRIGAVPADPDMVFGCMNVAAIGEPVKGYRYGYEHDRDTATRYLVGQAERRHGPIPFAWSKRLQVEGGEAMGLTIGETKWIPGEYVERPNWETLVVESVYIEGRTEWCEGAYSVLMPREDRRQLRADVTLEIDGDATVYPIATNSGGKIHLSADQVRNIAGDSVFETLALTIAGKVVYVLAWLFAQGDSRFLTVRSDGRCFAGKDAWKAQYLTREQVEAALRGEEVTEAVEICPPEPAESDSGPCVVAEAPEAPEALCEAVSGQDEPVTIADKLPAPEAVKDSLTTDPVAALVARVEALEAIVATLSAETGAPVDQRDDPTWRPASNGAGKLRWGVARFGGREWAESGSGRTIRFASREAAEALADNLNAPPTVAKRTAAHERAIRRAWAERRERNLMRAALESANAQYRKLDSERELAFERVRELEVAEVRLRNDLAIAQQSAGEAMRNAEAFARRGNQHRERRRRALLNLREMRGRAAHYYANWKEEARRCGEAEHAATFERQRAAVLAAQLAKAQEDLATAYSETELQAAVAVERERAASLRAELEAARAEGEGRADGAGVAAAQAAAQMARAIAAEEAVAAVRADLDKERAALAAVTARNARLLQSMADLTERVERAEAAIAA
jgi:DNA polymerase III sliding clamp (beta) subunit (PCNA family)